jgi:hypothetical protein
MSDASRHALYFIKEDVYGTTPAVTPAFSRFRHTGTTLGTTKSTNVSEELRPDRQIADFRHGTKQVGGDVSFELSFGSFDPILEAVMLGTWAPAIDIENDDTISAAASDNSYNGTGFPPLRAGDRITVAGFTEAGNNGVKTVVSGTSTKIVVQEPLVDEAAGDDIDIISDREVLKAGVLRRSFTLMRHFSDILEAGNPFHLFKGVEFNTINLSISPDSIITGSFGVLGREPLVAGTAPTGAILGNPTTTRVFDSFTGEIKEGGATIAIVTEISLTLENGLEPRFVVFDDLTRRPSIGRSNCTGQATVFFEDSTMLEKFLDETISSLEFSCVDEEGNLYWFRFPHIKYTGGQPDTSGQGSITLSMPFQAIYDEDLRTQLVIERVSA